MGYFAVVKLEDIDGQDVWRGKGKATKVLVQALDYVKQKESNKNVVTVLGEYLANDFEALGKSFEELERFFKKSKNKNDKQ